MRYLLLILCMGYLQACQAQSSQPLNEQASKPGQSNQTSRQQTESFNGVKHSGKPQGIFVSSGPRVSDEVLNQPHVAGNLVRVGWKDVEPAPGKYNFDSIHQKIAQAKKLNKKVALAVLNGPRTPDWLYEAGAEAYDFEFKNRYAHKGDRPERIPVPWDPVYLKHWLGLIKALGQEFAEESAVELVHITHASKNGFEMHLPEQRINRRRETLSFGPWKDRGYTPDKHLNALRQVVDGFAKAFPHHPLDIEIHPVLESLKVPTQIYQYGLKRYGQRFGLLAAWWSGKQQRWNIELSQILYDACEKSFCTIQMIGNQTRHPQRLLEESLLKAMEKAREKGARYFEVWDIDLRNELLTAELKQFAERLE